MLTTENKWSELLHKNDLTSFEAIWQLNSDWFEPPNHRRNGWSGVSQVSLNKTPSKQFRVFLKRQENHTTRSTIPPFKKIPTFEREYKMMQRLIKHNIGTPKPIYFGKRKVDGKLQAIFITKELKRFEPLDTVLQDWSKGLLNQKIRHTLMSSVAETLRRLHNARLQHRSLYPKHIMLDKKALYACNDSMIDIKLIDLEKTRWFPSRLYVIARDLYSLNCHIAQHYTLKNADRIRFLRHYFGISKLNKEAKFIWRWMASLVKKHQRDDYFKPSSQKPLLSL